MKDALAGIAGVALQNPAFDYYHAKVFDDGHIEFYPQVLTDASISVRTLAMMDSAMANIGRRKAGQVLNPRDVLDITGDEDDQA